MNAKSFESSTQTERSQMFHILATFTASSQLGLVAGLALGGAGVAYWSSLNRIAPGPAFRLLIARGQLPVFH